MDYSLRPLPFQSKPMQSPLQISQNKNKPKFSGMIVKTDPEFNPLSITLHKPTPWERFTAIFSKNTLHTPGALLVDNGNPPSRKLQRKPWLDDECVTAYRLPGLRHIVEALEGYIPTTKEKSNYAQHEGIKRILEQLLSSISDRQMYWTPRHQIDPDQLEMVEVDDERYTQMTKKMHQAIQETRRLTPEQLIYDDTQTLLINFKA